jgi:hypothetical protein
MPFTHKFQHEGREILVLNENEVVITGTPITYFRGKNGPYYLPPSCSRKWNPVPLDIMYKLNFAECRDFEFEKSDRGNWFNMTVPANDGTEHRICLPEYFTSPSSPPAKIPERQIDLLYQHAQDVFPRGFSHLELSCDKKISRVIYDLNDEPVHMRPTLDLKNKREKFVTVSFELDTKRYKGLTISKDYTYKGKWNGLDEPDLFHTSMMMEDTPVKISVLHSIRRTDEHREYHIETRGELDTQTLCRLITFVADLYDPSRPPPPPSPPSEWIPNKDHIHLWYASTGAPYDRYRHDMRASQEKRKPSDSAREEDDSPAKHGKLCDGV